MSYTINLTNGNVFATIPDGTINTTSSMTLVGKNYAGYGQFLDDNFIHLLESGANNTPPSAPLTGQLWFNTTSSVLNVYNGTGFKPIGGANATSTAPTNNTVGDLWYDTTNAQLNVWTGTAWLLVGPVYTSTTGITGAIPSTVVDNTSTTHVVIQLYVGASLVGFISKDAPFTPQTPISGFTTIRPGITLSTVVGTQVPLFQGTATNAQQIGGLLSTQFMRSDVSTSTAGSLGVGTTSGNLTVGPNSDFVVSVANSAVTLRNVDNNGNITISANVAGNTTSVIAVNGSTGNVTIPSLLVGANFGLTQIGTKLYFQYNGANIASMDSTGNITTATNVTAYGTP